MLGALARLSTYPPNVRPGFEIAPHRKKCTRSSEISKDLLPGREESPISGPQAAKQLIDPGACLGVLARDPVFEYSSAKSFAVRRRMRMRTRSGRPSLSYDTPIHNSGRTAARL